MPDLDSGHYFLTTLAPIKDSAAGDHRHASHTQAVRIALARLSPALQSPATEKIGVGSPFARNRRTHLARMFVLNDVVFNGRVGRNALAASLTGDDPAVAQPVDRLNTSYLVFCADIDAVEEDGAPLPKVLSSDGHRRVRAAYARELWTTMEEELRAVYSHCEGFDGVETADDFAAYLERCHVETTMPFHDYYLQLPRFNRLPLKALIAVVAAPLVVALIALLMRLLGVAEMPGLGLGTLQTFFLGLILTAAAAVGAIFYVLRNGEQPLPPGRYDDLPSVLKALYLQRHFSNFVVDAQGATPEDLHAQFGAFLHRHRPSDRIAPTQPPGVIAADT